MTKEGPQGITYDEWKQLGEGLSGIAKGRNARVRSNVQDARRASVRNEMQNVNTGRTYLLDPEKVNKVVKDDENIMNLGYVYSNKALKEAMQERTNKLRMPQFFGIGEKPARKLIQKSQRAKLDSDDLIGFPKSLDNNWEGSWFKSKEDYINNLKNLRNGGIIKAQEGVKAGENYKDWYGQIYSSYGDDIINGLLNSKDIEADVQWLNNMQTNHASIYNQAKDTDYFAKAWKPSDNSVANYQAEYTGGGGFTNGKPGGFNDYGITTNWDKRYVFGGKRISGDKPKVFKNDNLFSAITDDRRLLGRLGDWTDENLNAFNDRIKSTGYRLELDPSDNYYKLKTLTDVGPVVKPRTTKVGTVGSTGQQTAVDKLDPKASIYNTEFKNPMDPTPFITAGKTALGLFGNKDIYGNLLKEYPHPALQDPLHRQLAIVGNQRIIDEARNKLGDLRKITIQQRGNDSQVNFAKDLETERIGREIFDNAFRQDASRQFDTAQKLWNLKNEDTFTNWKMAYENRKAIENYNKTLAQIRAAWRSGNNNILMGAAADTGNWLMKGFQREQDTVDRARALALGTPEEWAQSEYTSRLGDLANKKASDMTEQEKAKAEAIKAQVLREMRQKYSEKYYTNFNNGWFGGGYKEKLLGKNGTKLEVEKLKARGKDNDRYVSMIKDLRTTKRRRR